MTASAKRQKREAYRKTHREEGGNTELPQKRFYRQRAHANPFSDHQLIYPASPSLMDWSPFYPAFVDPLTKSELAEGQPKPLRKRATVVDIGCGFGGLLVAMAPMLPDELILGLEIRTQVTEYVQDRISALRSQHAPSIGGRKTSFPNMTVEKDAYTRLPLPADPPPAGKKAYIIYAKDGEDDSAIQNTEPAIQEITGQAQIPSYQTPQNSTTWTANLTPTQAAEIQKLQGIHHLSENTLSPSPNEGQTPDYHSPTTRTTTPTPPPTPYQNISVLRANTMKFLPNLFHKSQLSTLFLCFPDPHFKARKHKQRIVSATLCAEYAYVLRPGGYVYTITDVEELGGWMRERFRGFGGGKVWEGVEVPEEGEEGEWIGDWGGGGERGMVGRMVRAIREETEEGKKVGRNGGRKFVGVWRRREDPAWPGEE